MVTSTKLSIWLLRVLPPKSKVSVLVDCIKDAMNASVIWPTSVLVITPISASNPSSKPLSSLATDILVCRLLALSLLNTPVLLVVPVNASSIPLKLIVLTISPTKLKNVVFKL